MENRQEMLNYIHENTTIASQWAQLAEEAVELAHCAQKIERILRREQPVAEGVTFEKELEHMIEEFGDVELCVQVLQEFEYGKHENVRKLLDGSNAKLERWYNRVKKEKEKNESKT